MSQNAKVIFHTWNNNLKSQGCSNLDSLCTTCSSGTECTSCSSGRYAYGSTCLNSCPVNTYKYGGVCYNTCPSRTFAWGSICVDECPSGTYPNGGQCTGIFLDLKFTHPKKRAVHLIRYVRSV